MARLTIQPGDQPSRIKLVQKAIALWNTTGCFEWIDAETQIRVGCDPSNRGLTAAEIRKLAWDWIVNQSGIVHERQESRPEYTSRREYYYFVIVPVAEFPRGLFVEMELSNFDSDYPVVALLNAHPERQGPILQ